ncbi:MAG: hypothetical protein HS114_00600 [Anaerolineales bacterium]|nr:hypothetical protein [Anaerolineales bacterium]
MKAAQSFGDLKTATILVIGHDPRLQRSRAEAEIVFFFDYLTRVRPAARAEAKKYELAEAVQKYISQLAGREVSLAELYVTNLCNKFLDHVPNSGTVLIPDEQAQRGVEEISQIVAGGHFKVILPMSVQTFYHLCRWRFIDETNQVLTQFIHAARPVPERAKLGLYQQSGKAPFLTVCGQRFHHEGVPVVPILHVKQWPLRLRMRRYADPMQQAQWQIQTLLRSIPGRRDE